MMKTNSIKLDGDSVKNKKIDIDCVKWYLKKMILKQKLQMKSLMK
jgi:hypothetical protein